MSALHLVRLCYHPSALLRFGHEQRLLEHDDETHGYLLHAWLTALFGSFAPRPFRHIESRCEVLGYADVDALHLQEHALAFAAPSVFRALQKDNLATKPMPEVWREGFVFSFEVLAPPVVRTQKGVEKDALLHALDCLGDQAPERGTPQLRTLREQTYCKWLLQQMGESAVLEQLFLAGFARRRLMRRRHDAGRSHHTIERPVALFQGQGRIRDPQAFSRLLRRGIGRHRAFGMGMLLLSPPKRER